MSSKYSVQVRIRVNGSKHDVTGSSKYSNQSYDTKFKNAVMNAIFIDADNRHKKVRYDTKYDYELHSHAISYVGRAKKHAPKGVNRRLHKEIILLRDKRLANYEKEQSREKALNKPISRKRQHEELYGKKKPRIAHKEGSRARSGGTSMRKIRELRSENAVLKRKLAHQDRDIALLKQLVKRKR